MWGWAKKGGRGGLMKANSGGRWTGALFREERAHFLHSGSLRVTLCRER